MSERRTALHGEIDSDAFPSDLIVREIADHSFLDLRGRAEDAGFTAMVGELLGLELPQSPNTWSSGNQAQAFWMGPDQWLLLLDDGEQTKIEAQLRSSLKGHFAVTDISSGQTLLELDGEHAKLALRMAVPYDLESLKHGRCAQTAFAKTQVLLWPHRASWRLIVRRSYADYVLLWLRGIRLQ